MYYFKKLVIVLIFLITAVAGNSQKFSNGDGSWANASMWIPAGVPGPGDDVVIADGDDVNIPSGFSAQCASISFFAGFQASSLSVLGTGSSLTVSGSITMNSATQSGIDRTLLVTGGQLTCASIIMASTGSDLIRNILQITNTATVSGSITMNDASPQRNTVVINNPGRLNVGGGITGGGLSANSGSIVDYNSAGAQSMRPDTYANLVMSGGGSKTGAVTVTEKLTLKGTATAASGVTYSSAILEYNGSAAQTVSVNEFPAVASGLTEIIINNSNGVTIGAAKTLSSNLTLATGVLNASNNISIGSTPGLVITRSDGSLNGAIQGGNSYNVTYTGSSKPTGAELSGAGLNDISVNLISGTAQTLTLDQNRTPSGNVALNTGDFDLGAFTFNNSGSKNFSAATGTTLYIGGTNSLPTGYTYALDANNTVNYNGSNQSIGTSTSYGNLRLSGSGTKTLAGNGVVTGDLLVVVGATVSLGPNNLTINSTQSRNVTVYGVVNINGDGRLLKLGAGTKTLVLGSGSFLNITDAGGALLPVFDSYIIFGSSTIVFGAPDAQTIENSITYGNLTVSGGNTKSFEAGGGAMTFLGSVTIGPSTTLNGDTRTINIEGNWHNDGTFIQTGTGTVVLDGFDSQIIDGSATTDFNRLTINNSSAAGIILGHSFTIQGVMTFMDGVVFSSNTNHPIINNDATVSGASDNSFVDGPVVKLGDDAFTFPIGKDGFGYHFASITATFDAAASFLAEYKRLSATTLGPITAVGLLNVSNCEFWEISRLNSSQNPVLTLSWSASSPCGGSYITNITGLQVAAYNGTSWSEFSRINTSGDVVTGTVFRSTSNSLWSNYPYFTIGNNLPNENPLSNISILPVKFGNITAFEKQQGVQVEWVSYHESNLSHYEVERSADGIAFSSIGNVPAKNISGDVSYSFYDPAPLSGVNFYRLRHIDLDGRSGFSNIVKVVIGGNTKDITIYPNPVSDGHVSLYTSHLMKGNYVVSIFNSGGQLIYTLPFYHHGGAINQTIELPGTIQNGIYNLRLDADGSKIISRTFVVAK